MPAASPPMALYHRDLGGAGDPPRVILHGMLGSSRNWQTAGRELSSRHRTYALDLRNHGLSPHADAMSYEAMASDVLAWLDARGIPAAEIIGHSMGGKVAMLLACRHPARVSGLVIVDIAPRDYHGTQHPAEFAAMQEIDLATLATRAQAESRLEARVPGWAMRKFIATNLERLPEGGWKWLINLPVLASALPALERNPLSPGDRFGGPAHVIVGGRSGYVRPRDHAAILVHFPRARITVLPDSGHNPHMEQRGDFVRAVESEG